MRTPEPAADAVWDIARPASPGALPGVTMAGFRARSREPIDLSTVPYPAVTVVFDFSAEPLVVEDAGGGRERGSLVAGITPRRSRASGRDVECLQVRLSPVIAHAALSGAPGLADTVTPLEDLWGRDASRLQDQLRATTSWAERFAIVEDQLGRRHETGPRVDPEVELAWRRMVARRGLVRVEALADEVGWSRKRLWSRFRVQVGLTPKRAAQLIRFDEAVHRLAAGHGGARVAAETGYADQSHLHRDVVRFAGVTPTAAAVAPWLAVDDVAWA
jgi:AraC-like DNA-binding protein